ncbi:MAG: FlgD immunoglobulin-like domain containing protein, partial [bacterium]
MDTICNDTIDERLTKLQISRIAFFIFLLLALHDSCLSQTADTLWSQNWEDPNWPDHWSVQGGTWEVGVPTAGPDSCFSPPNCAATGLGNYSEPVDARLLRHSSFVVPSAAENPRLRFWHWFSLAGGDTGFVQIKVENGEWETISIPYTGSGCSAWTYPFIDLTPFAGLTVQIAFYFKSRPIGHWGEVSTGWYIDEVCVMTGPIVFNEFENWESGIGDWYVDKGTWEVGIPTTGPGSAFDGEISAGTVLRGNYCEPVASRLISPPFIVPSAGENPRLRFWHWFSLAGGDTGFVQIKIDNGEWQTISIPYTGSGCGAWTYPSIDLTSYGGLSIQIALYFKSCPVGHWGEVSTGWYIDNIAVITGPLEINSLTTWESGLGSWFVDKGTWEVGTPTIGPNSCFSEPNCAGTVVRGNYCEPVDTRLTSPPFIVPTADKNPTLRYWHWFNLAAGDTGYVQIKVENGEWKTIGEDTAKGTGGNAWTSPPPIALTPYADKIVQIGFYLKSHPKGHWGEVSSGWYIDDVAIMPKPIVVSVDETPQIDIPSQFVLLRNYPNPFNPETTIRYQLPKSGHVKLEIYNTLGQKILTLVNQQQPAGNYQVTWDGRDNSGKQVASGIYLYQLKSGEF